MNTKNIEQLWQHFSKKVVTFSRQNNLKQKLRKTITDYLLVKIYESMYSLIQVPKEDLRYAKSCADEFNFKIPKLERLYAAYFLKLRNEDYREEDIRKQFRKTLIEAHLQGKDSYEVFKSLCKQIFNRK